MKEIKFLNNYNKLKIESKAAIWYTICSFIQKGIIFVTTPIFSRLLSPTEFGIFSVFTTWQNIIIIFASLNLASGVFLRGLIKYEDDENEFCSSLYSLFGLVFLIAFLIYLVFSGFWNSLFTLPFKYMVFMFADMLMAVAFHFWSAYQRVHYTYKKLIIVTVANAILRPVLGIIAVLSMSDKVGGRIYSMTVADILCFGAFFVFMYYKRTPVISTKYWGYALNYNIPLVPHYLSQIVLNQSDRIMIKSMVGADCAGIYSLSYTCASIMHVVSQSILNSYNPWMYRKIKNNEQKDINSISIKLLTLIAVCNLFLIIFAPELIAILAPKGYHEAIWIIPPVAMSMYFTFMYSLFSNFEFYYEKTGFMMIASVSGALLNILLNYLFIPLFGYMAAGYTTLICYLFYCIAHYLMMRHILNKEQPGLKIYNLSVIFAISFVFIIAGFVFMYLYNFPAVRYIIMFVMSAALFYKRKYVLSLIKGLKK